MKKCILTLTLCLIGLVSFAQPAPVSEDSVVNRLKYNELTLRIESGVAESEDFYNRGILNAAFKDTSAAIKDYSAAISKKKSFDLPYLNRGSLYQQQGKFKLAEKDFNAAIKLVKSPSFAYNNRGYLYQNWDKIDLAIKDLEKSIKCDPTYTQPYMNLVDIYLSAKDNEATFSVLNRMVAARPNDPKALTSRSEVYRNLGKFQEALNDINAAIEVSGDDPDYIIERAKLKDDYIFDDYGAVEDCHLAIQRDPYKADYYYQLSRPLYDLAEYTEVLENCDKALELDPKHVNALIMKANVTDLYKFYDDARELYKRAISIAPDEYDSYKQLSISEFAQGNKKKALSILETYMDRGNFHKDITEQHGKIAADLKMFDVSIEDFSLLVEKEPKNPVNYFLRGIAKDSIKNHEAACDDMVIADKLGLREAHQYLRLHCKSRLSAKLIKIEDMLDEAYELERNKRDREAIAMYTDLITIAPDSSSFYYNRGKAKRRMNNHEGAIEDYLKAIEMDNNRVQYIVSLAVSYSYLDRIDEAIKEYKKAIKIEPRYAMSYYNLGGIYAQDKKYEKAIEFYETSLIYSPNYTRAMMGLGDCYLEMDELDKACEWYKRAENAGETKAFGKRVRTCK